MNKTKNKTPEKTPAGAVQPAVQAKRYDQAFKQEAVANWIKTGQSGTKIAAEISAVIKTTTQTTRARLTWMQRQKYLMRSAPH